MLNCASLEARKPIVGVLSADPLFGLCAVRTADVSLAGASALAGAGGSSMTSGANCDPRREVRPGSDGGGRWGMDGEEAVDEEVEAADGMMD